MKLNSKIAVFVCGPVRYASLVNQRLEHILADVDYDCFFHLWKQDLGNKKRENEETDINCLGRHAKAKVVAYQSPYTIQDFSDYVGTKTNSNSSINATMGMFYSINALCHFLEQLPDSNHYEYILRIRTDCAILNDKFIDKLSFSKKTLTIS